MSVDAILTRHFLRRFLENDLLSPDADSLQLLSVMGAALVSSTLFISAFMSFTYVGAPYTPGQLAAGALNDRFFYVALSMVVVGLVAVAQWDALVVDARDAAILEPLPLRPARVRRAKLAAVAILGFAVALAVNIVPSVVFPWLLVYHTQLRVVDLLAIIVVHLAVTVAAGAFAYLAVIALRETLATLLPARLFARVSPWVQGGLIIALGTALLMVPPAAGETTRRGFEGNQALSPPNWFVGAYESAVGALLADHPRGRMTPRQARADQIMSAVYARHRDAFPGLARRALYGLAVVSLLTAAAYAVNIRRFSALAPPTAPAVRRRWRHGAALAGALIARDSTTRAGFFFTLAAMWRSGAHRLTIAGGAAAGVAMSLIALSNTSLQDLVRGEVPPPGVLVVQPLLYGALLVAFRHAIRVPAELRANWGFQLAWREHERQFLAGARRAAMVTLAVPALAVTLPLFAYLLGPQLALVHAALGLAGALVVLEVLLVGYNKVPFTCTYVPNESMKALGPFYFFTFMIGATLFSRMQGAALQDAGAAVQLLALLAVIFAALRIAAVRIRRPELVDFNEAPVTTQRLGLHT